MVSCFGEFGTTYYHSAYILVSNPNQYPCKNSFSQVKRGGGGRYIALFHLDKTKLFIR